ncbi:MAG: arylesterase, partial [Pseudomonadota bacterium]|nr:arylesterase [Pseudomonadota bacterium]
MKRFFERFLVFLLLALPWSPALAQDIRVVVYGDSLTSGYELQPEQAFPARLDSKLKAVGFTNVKVINMSVAGETTAGGVERMPSLLAQHPDIVVVELGANDALRGINTIMISSNLSNIVNQLHSNNIYVVLIGMKA